MPWLAPSEAAELRAEGRAARGPVTAGVHAVRFYGGLVLLAVMCLAATTPALFITALMPRRVRERVARRSIQAIFNRQFTLMQWLGVMRLDLSALDALRDAPPMVIAPNHPSMIDAALLLSRLPNLVCVMKADVLDNPIFGSGARMAGYITNTPLKKMMRAAQETLAGGRHLLLFPEGTRTVRLPTNDFQRTVGVVARQARVPVQTVIIETRSPFLAKGWPLLKLPLLPLVYRARLGERFEPGADVDAFMAELLAYFESELAGAQLPRLPVTRNSR